MAKQLPAQALALLPFESSTITVVTDAHKAVLAYVYHDLHEPQHTAVQFVQVPGLDHQYHGHARTLIWDKIIQQGGREMSTWHKRVRLDPTKVEYYWSHQSHLRAF